MMGGDCPGQDFSAGRGAHHAALLKKDAPNRLCGYTLVLAYGEP